MTVRRILADKGGDVVTIPPDASVAEAAALLAGKRIGAVLVTDGGGIAGILSERDLVRALAEHGSEAVRRLASDCMTVRVSTCRPDDTIDTVMQTMTEGRFRHLPVVDAGRLVGIVSIGDVVKWRIAEVEREAADIRSYIATA